MYVPHEVLLEDDTWATLQGVCKDCNNGTLNNALNPAFELLASDGCDDEELRCISCGSTHLDIL